MSRECPNCNNVVSIWRWRGPIIRYDEKPSVSWVRFTPERHCCRNCGAQIRRRTTTPGFALWAAFLGLGSMAAFSGLTHAGLLPTALFALLCVPLSLAIALWGTRWCLVRSTTADPEALS
jgi:hypothetical protein